ncbi:hypothetical protein P4S72_22235 [Vibrio sp. PP-XX7]
MIFNRRVIIFAIPVIGISCIASTVSATEEKPFRVGYFELIPHTFPKNDSNKNNEKSLAIEYFKRIGMEMGLSEMTFKQYPLARLLHLLERRELDAALLLAKNTERNAKFVYPKTPFFQMRAAIVLKNLIRYRRYDLFRIFYR